MSYKNPGSLVSTDWLAMRLGQPGIKVLDSTGGGAAAFRNCHIPGAVYFDFDDIADPDSKLAHMLPSESLFGEKVGALGVSNNDHVIVYDSNPLSSGARGWWMFRAFGHDKVSLLNGGLTKWVAEGRDTQSGDVSPAPATFEARLRGGLVRNVDEMLANVDNGDELVVDARAAERFAGGGKEVNPTKHAGHIPSSINIPYTELLGGPDHRFLGADALATKFRDAGVDMSRPVITTCGSGVTACVVALGLHLLGHDRVSVYDGSWSEWGNRNDTPIEK
jgi:thiosulfate/3-mercaptopyruvate sulfurtransferase